MHSPQVIPQHSDGAIAESLHYIGMNMCMQRFHVAELIKQDVRDLCE